MQVVAGTCRGAVHAVVLLCCVMPAACHVEDTSPAVSRAGLLGIVGWVDCLLHLNCTGVLPPFAANRLRACSGCGDSCRGIPSAGVYVKLMSFMLVC
jgi:hypothetical protein